MSPAYDALATHLAEYARLHPRMYRAVSRIIRTIPMPWKERLHYAAAVAVVIVAFVRNPWRVAGFWMMWGGAVGVAAALAWILTEPLRRRGMGGRVVANILLVLSTTVPTLMMMLFGWDFPKQH